MRFFNRRLLALLAITAFILLIPLVAMQFTNEVNWGWGDFLLAGLLLFATVFLIELLIRRISNKTYRLALIAVILIGLLLLWAELAVDIFENSIAGD